MLIYQSFINSALLFQSLPEIHLQSQGICILGRPLKAFLPISVQYFPGEVVKKDKQLALGSKS